MTNKIYYFVIPNPIEPKIVITMTEVFANNLKPSDADLLCFAHSQKNEDDFYTFLPQNKVEKIVNEFKALKVLFSFKDITEEVLMGVQNNNPLFAKTFEDMQHKQLLNSFLKQNQTIDNILDKIKILGINSLTEIDKEILELV
jgi:hypothetical protein